MANQQSSLRFDHREIAVVFSLFIFTSLLMFTVGIMVGKGITQAKFESTQASVGGSGHLSLRLPSSENPHGADAATLGTSVSTDHPAEAHEPSHDTAAAAGEHVEASGAHADEAKKLVHGKEGEHDNSLAALTDQVSEPSKPEHDAEHGAKQEAPHGVTHANTAETTDLELIPEKGKTGDLRGTLQDFPKTAEVDRVMKNPKIKGLLEEDPTAHRAVASTPGKIPKSFTQGKYTVQVGSYPTQIDATSRVEALKKIGFPNSYFTAKELGGKKDTWYRVWLGYFPDAESAKAGGEVLQARGEVKSYLVRKSDSKED